MRKIDLFFAEYCKNHRNKTNKLIHWMCVPLTFWSILGFISLLPSPHICSPYFGCASIISMVAVAFITLFYLRLSFLISMMMLIIMILMEGSIYMVNIRFLKNAWIIYFSIFVVTWILRLFGHRIEGKKPPFLKDLQFLLMGPIWLLTFIFKKTGIKY
ncbi:MULTISPECIES: Mpo1 family 2-hydroxy fatty acid dioxygenase [Chryseobacterium]|uniref:Mpo1 family 2-hydroxy fatty acid dioxygenase n=1 Tax=Chryseobacterium TaxID=59732 RepID=UPI0023583E04|nr:MULTISPECIES: Mpo1-like protein [unclassified Chryseobacterium]MDC8103278.1 DUF962 domain-containing protein [Chryseobacterium sp. B21-037]MDQ1802830.1 DUF962 domain-containing protein [Chryseobacterium sp. CKR4-1]WBV56826.1 DUF962 domain-containing protein [Chryseobacterium daecheongense]